MKTARTQYSLFTILPNNFAWLVGITALMFFTLPNNKKMLINLLVAKVLFEAYTIVVKNVQEPDLIDSIAPHLTLYHRQFLADYVFSIVFTLLGHYFVSQDQSKHLEADLGLFKLKAEKAGVSSEAIKEFEKVAENIGVNQSKKED